MWLTTPPEYADVNEKGRAAEETAEFTGLMNIALQDKKKMYAAVIETASVRIYGVPHGAPG